MREGYHINEDYFGGSGLNKAGRMKSKSEANIFLREELQQQRGHHKRGGGGGGLQRPRRHRSSSNLVNDEVDGTFVNRGMEEEEDDGNEEYDMELMEAEMNHHQSKARLSKATSQISVASRNSRGTYLRENGIGLSYR